MSTLTFLTELGQTFNQNLHVTVRYHSDPYNAIAYSTTHTDLTTNFTSPFRVATRHTFHCESPQTRFHIKLASYSVRRGKYNLTKERSNHSKLADKNSQHVLCVGLG